MDSNPKNFVQNLTKNFYIVPKIIDFPRYNMNYSGENEILRGILHVISSSVYIPCYTVEIWIFFWTV